MQNLKKIGQVVRYVQKGDCVYDDDDNDDDNDDNDDDNAGMDQVLESHRMGLIIKWLSN